MATNCATLTIAVLRTRVGIRPAQIVPVVNVESEDDDAIGCHPPCRKAAYPAVCRRTTVTAFRSIELEQWHALRTTRHRAFICFHNHGYSEQSRCQAPCRMSQQVRLHFEDISRGYVRSEQVDAYGMHLTGSLQMTWPDWKARHSRNNVAR